jgi:YbgC/YbaW family acyl-CoA thioester hydrolase
MIEHVLRRRVQFAETDMAGIVHFSCFFKYMEEAEHALWRAAGLSIATVDEEIGWPRIAAAFDYHAPLRFEEEFEIAIRVVAVLSRTIEYRCEIARGGTRIASGTLKIACVSKRKGEAMRSISVPPAIAATFSAPGES